MNLLGWGFKTITILNVNEFDGGGGRGSSIDTLLVLSRLETPIMNQRTPSWSKCASWQSGKTEESISITLNFEILKSHQSLTAIKHHSNFFEELPRGTCTIKRTLGSDRDEQKTISYLNSWNLFDIKSTNTRRHSINSWKKLLPYCCDLVSSCSFYSSCDFFWCPIRNNHLCWPIIYGW